MSRLHLGVGGAILLTIGVFAPLIRLPIIGDINYFQNGQGDGVIILILAAASLVLTMAGRYKGLWFTGIASLALIGFTYVNLQSTVQEIRVEMERDLAGNPFAGLAELAMQSVQFQWAWALLVIGAVAILAAAARNS